MLIIFAATKPTDDDTYDENQHYQEKSTGPGLVLLVLKWRLSKSVNLKGEGADRLEQT
jgi:hypothetical protein